MVEHSPKILASEKKKKATILPWPGVKYRKSISSMLIALDLDAWPRTTHSEHWNRLCIITCPVADVKRAWCCSCVCGSGVNDLWRCRELKLCERFVVVFSRGWNDITGVLFYVLKRCYRWALGFCVCWSGVNGVWRCSVLNWCTRCVLLSCLWKWCYRCVIVFCMLKWCDRFVVLFGRCWNDITGVCCSVRWSGVNCV